MRSKVNVIVFDFTDTNQLTRLKRVITGLAELNKLMFMHMFQRPWRALFFHLIPALALKRISPSLAEANMINL